MLAFLARPEAYAARLGAAPAEVERQETHISAIFLAGERAYKLKLARRYPYLDFSTLEARRVACEREIEINRRTAPEIYLGAVAVARAADGSLALGGDGETVEYVVEMMRFDQSTLFDRLAQEGRLDRRLMTELAREIAAFHAAAEEVPDAGGAEMTRGIIENNADAFAELPADIFGPAGVRRLTDDSLAAVDRLAGLLDARRDKGRVRHCHGDLHLRNIGLVDGRPTPFDAIEFNDAFAQIDVLYDLAFLLMDLDHRGHRELANVVLNGYLDAEDPDQLADVEGLAAMPLFLTMRAAIRAHVGAAAGDRDEPRAYLALARTYLAAPSACVVAVGGLSGTGKSRLARAVAGDLGPAPGARIVRTDAMRKRRQGIALEDKLPAESYTPEESRRTYDAVLREGAAVVAAGHAAILDAVFAKPGERAEAEALAREAGVPFCGLWLEAPTEARIERVGGRRADASDANADVARAQADYDLGEITWARVDTSGSPEESARRVRSALGPLVSARSGAS